MPSEGERDPWWLGKQRAPLRSVRSWRATPHARRAAALGLGRAVSAPDICVVSAVGDADQGSGCCQRRRPALVLGAPGGPAAGHRRPRGWCRCPPS
jgi:hypothetical protein